MLVCVCQRHFKQKPLLVQGCDNCMYDFRVACVLQRDMAPRPTKEPDLPEAPGYLATPAMPIQIDPAKELSEAECAE